MDSPRRSARLARNQPSNTSTSSQFSQSSSRYSSAATSAFPSPDNDMHQTSLHSSQSHASLQVPSGPNSFNAPLPSPSASNMNPFFGRPHSQPNLLSSAIHSQQGSYNMGPQMQPSAQQQSHLQYGQPVPQPNNMLPPAGAGPLPPDFDVLAEAAKRAQMACLMRDLGDVSL